MHSPNHASSSRARAPRFGRRRALTRLVALGFVAYGAHALLELQFAAPPADDGEGAIVGVACDGADPETRAEACRAPSAVVVELRLPDPDPESGKSRYYGANHWFHVCEFHLHNHAKLRAANALPPGPGPADRAVPAVILRLADARWRAQLTPMTRLLLALAYTDGTARRVSYAPPSAVATSPTDATSEVALACGWSARSWHAALDQPALERFVVDAGADRADECGEARAALRVGPSEDAKRPSGPAGKKRVSFGAAKAERGDWVPTDADAAFMRTTIERLCAAAPGGAPLGPGEDVRALPAAAREATTGLLSQPCFERAAGAAGVGRRAVIYQRDAGRALEAVDEVASALKRALEASGGGGGAWRVSVVTHHDALPPCALAACLRDAEVLLTPHGFQSMLYLFLPPRATLFEVFPHRYYKHGYKRAALEWGGAHAFTISPPRNLASRVISAAVATGRCMSMYYCRYVARKGSVLVEPRDVDAVVRAVAASASEAKALAPPRESPIGEGRVASSGPSGPSGVEWAAAGEAMSRAACLAACAANHSGQRFRFEEEEGGREAGGDARCALRVDPGQGERDGDVIGAGIYNNKCWVPGC